MIRYLAPYGIVEEDLMTESVFNKVMIFESCIDALGSGDAVPDIVSTSTAYTYSIVMEVLDNAKEVLLKLIQKVLSVLNNYYLNNVKLIDKYREVILDRLPTKGPIILHETYEYPAMKDYPKALKSTISAEKDILRLHSDLIADPGLAVGYQVDKLLQRFGKEVLGMEPDPDDLKGSTADIVRATMRGEMTKVQIDRKTLNSYIDQISSYKADKEDLMRTKKSVVDDYEALKRTYAKVTKDPMSLARNRIEQMAHPEKEALLSHEYQRFANIHMEMMRLFNGYITIYKVAFDTKLDEIMQKVEDRKNVITEIITRTGLFAALNTKNPAKDGKPIPYKPGLNL
ncbi:MAG: hypothetical protein NC311_05770 [Muribaculaceae bacterium]|nr:hypothetical protein [Ruminococcus flavefaciens]MCM1295031.1 hypothetical protein [Muribaculaceae bacterium]